FWGKERFLEKQEDGHGHGNDDHGHHVHIPHESPRNMTLPLVVLAVLATIGGFVGVGPAFRLLTRSEHPGGRLNIVRWLDPVVWNASTKEFGQLEVAGGHETPTAEPAHGAAATPAGGHAATTGVYGDVGFNLAHSVEGALHNELLTEWLFIVLSVVAAGIGMGLGWLFYLKNPSLPDTWAARLRRLYN